MMIGYYYFDEPIIFEENCIQELVIENQKMFRNFITTLSDGIAGYDTELIISRNNNEIISVEKCMELIFSPLYLDFRNKRIGNKLIESLSVTAKDLEDDFYQLAKEINRFGTNISLQSDYEITFDEILHLSQLIKLLGFEIDINDLNVNERIIEYMHICNNLLGKEIFVFVGLKSYFTEEEMEMLLKDMAATKYNVLLIENVQRKYISKYERRRIIDNDFCEIY